MIEYKRSEEDLRKDGYKALTEALGPADMARFVQSISLGSGDYTQEKQYEIYGDFDLDEFEGTATLTINGHALDHSESGDNRHEITAADLTGAGFVVPEHIDDEDEQIGVMELPGELFEEIQAELVNQKEMEKKAMAERETERIIEKHYKGARRAAIDYKQGFANHWSMYPICSLQDFEEARKRGYGFVSMERASELVGMFNDYAYGDSATKNCVELDGVL